MASDPQLTDEPQEEAFVATWAAEVLGTADGRAVKIQVTFAEEPNHDREAKVRAEAQSVMRRQHNVWCTAMTYRKWQL